jgi:hypothetical protein
MITKCANQSCGQPFRYFRGGRLFIVDVGLNAQSIDSSTTDRAPLKLEHFWLCELCAETMTMVVGQDRTATVISTREELPSAGERQHSPPCGAGTRKMIAHRFNGGSARSITTRVCAPGLDARVMRRLSAASTMNNKNGL